jgi:hypothetical protein
MGLDKLFTFKSKMSEEVTVSVGKTLGWSDLLSFGKDKALVLVSRTFLYSPVMTT